MCLKVRTWWKPDIWLQELPSKFVGKLQRQQLRVQYAWWVCPSYRKVKKGETYVQGALSTLCSSCLRDTQYKLRSYNLITWPECGPPLNFEQKEIVQQYFAMNRERGKLYLLLKLSTRWHLSQHMTLYLHYIVPSLFHYTMPWGGLKSFGQRFWLTHNIELLHLLQFYT